MDNSASPGDPDSLDFGTRVGMIFVVQAAAMSALAVSALLAYITYSAATIHRNASRRWSTDTHIHYYFLNLMVCDLMQAIGGLLNIKWISEARVYPSPTCTVQGLFKQVGDVGVALSTMAIALYTLQVLVFHFNSSPKFALVVLAVIWVITALLVAIPNAIQHGLYNPTGQWCWINERRSEQIGLEYLWMWIAAFLHIVVYVFLALVLKRVIIIDGHRLRWPRGGRERQRSFLSSTNYDPEPRRDEGIIAFQLLFYPAVYIIVVLPISAARFSSFNGNYVPFPVTAVADTLFALDGLLNVALYSLTRPKLIPRRPARDRTVILSPVTPGTQLARIYRTPILAPDLSWDPKAGRASSDYVWQGPLGSPDQRY
ncbi:hypothetical protein PAXRUDRAFT_139473 [Paxillus rubicundulus Ve08.2h10]|uniref:Glucose receptor Git3 N-terminal domain-containing protein n=1 Tax=Paxillus rubicundulus Ve08.2h10 TaxID=930991 RepID=A0A0D0DZL1_9AGAM|nr:hypothetical protein PAXRUDRAFT_139473 [Paxillus rubicundulus Ve08.2h10]